MFIGLILRRRHSRPNRTAGRCDDGFGLVEEVDGLFRAGVDEDSTPMRSVGYREIVRFLRREMTIEEATAAIIVLLGNTHADSEPGCARKRGDSA